MTAGRGPVRRFLAWCWMDISQGETIDLWLLVAASLFFTVLGATGIASIQVLSSVELALLASPPGNVAERASSKLTFPTPTTRLDHGLHSPTRLPG